MQVGKSFLRGKLEQSRTKREDCSKLSRKKQAGKRFLRGKLEQSGVNRGVCSKMAREEASESVENWSKVVIKGKIAPS